MYVSGYAVYMKILHNTYYLNKQGNLLQDLVVKFFRFLAYAIMFFAETFEKIE